MIFLNIKKQNKNRLYNGTLIHTRALPFVELNGNREAIIEGCDGIIEYDDVRAVINCRSHTITFSGFGICLCNLSVDSIKVTGNFTDISFSEL